jgi:hypothetical protein
MPANWDDEINDILRRKGIDPTAEETHDPGLLPLPEVAKYVPAMREPDAMDYFQLKTEMRNYAKAAVDEIEHLKTENADIAAELYRKDREVEAINILLVEMDKSTHTCMTKIEELYDYINSLEPIQKTPWYRDDTTRVLVVLALIFIVLAAWSLMK